MAIAWLSGELCEYDEWLDGVELARWEALMRDPSREKGALRFAVDLTDAERAGAARRGPRG